jgi:hypothetical protein
MRDLFLLALALASGQAMSTREAIQMDMEKFNNDAMCWGVENMMGFRLQQYKAMEECGRSGLASGLVRPTNPFTTLPGNLNNPFAHQNQNQNPLNKLFNKANNKFNSNANSRNPLSALLSRKSIGNSAQHAWDSLFRSRRASEEGLLEIDEEQELEKFIEDFNDFKEDIGSMIGNLTCVLTKMDMLDSSLQVNLKLWTTDIWQQLNLKKTLAGEDPEWRQKLIGGYTDCYQVASNWPQQSLDRNPITKVFGRHMIFFKCAMKQEKKMCGMAQMYSWLTTLYGNSDDFNWSQFGLPTDKYDRAALTVMVQTEASSKEDKFINDFFINDEL